ncbi:MAG: hypothetical protein GY925_24585 [Actinomycetia bacterium]|nr:hypothetical protein [Actinomycetes bacterium]
MRCCISSLNSREPQPDDVPGVTTLDCDHCASGLRLADDGVWEWNRPSEPIPPDWPTKTIEDRYNPDFWQAVMKAEASDEPEPEPEPLAVRLNQVALDAIELEQRLEDMVGDMREAHALLMVGKSDLARAKLNRWTDVEDTAKPSEPSGGENDG